MSEPNGGGGGRISSSPQKMKNPSLLPAAEWASTLLFPRVWCTELKNTDHLGKSLRGQRLGTHSWKFRFTSFDVKHKSLRFLTSPTDDSFEL